MDEYLSKPLKQNQMMQTILKCATLGGSLLEKSKESRLSSSGEIHHHSEGKRPGMETRSITASGSIDRGFSSPAAAKDDEIAMERALLRSNSS